MLKFFYVSESDVPAEYAELYAEKNGRFELVVEGIKTVEDVTRLQTALTKEREAHKSTKASLSAYSDLGTLDDLQAKFDSYRELEIKASGSVDSEKLSQLLAEKTAAINKANERNLATRDATIKELTEQNSKLVTTEQNRVKSDAIRKAAIAANVRPEMIDDIVELNVNKFTINDSGDIVRCEGDANANLDITSWLADTKDSKAHWWGDSVGGGSTGGKAGQVTNNPWKKDNWDFDAQSRVFAENPDRAAKLAAAAKSYIGATDPTE